MLVFTLPGAAKPGDTLVCLINGEPCRLKWSADTRYVTLSDSDRREIISIGQPGLYGVRTVWCEDKQHRWRITNATAGQATIIISAEDAEAARHKFEAGDANAAEWATVDERGISYEITEASRHDA